MMLESNYSKLCMDHVNATFFCSSHANLQTSNEQWVGAGVLLILINEKTRMHHNNSSCPPSLKPRNLFYFHDNMGISNKRKNCSLLFQDRYTNFLYKTRDSDCWESNLELLGIHVKIKNEIEEINPGGSPPKEVATFKDGRSGLQSSLPIILSWFLSNTLY